VKSLSILLTKSTTFYDVRRIGLYVRQVGIGVSSVMIVRPCDPVLLWSAKCILIPVPVPRMSAGLAACALCSRIAPCMSD